MFPVTLNLLDSGVWTLDVPAAQVRVVVRVQSSHHGPVAEGTTQEGHRVTLREFAGVVQLSYVDTGQCFTFPTETPHRHRIVGGVYERVCGDGVRDEFRARKGRRCTR